MKTTTVSLSQNFDDFVEESVEKKEMALKELDALLEHSIERGGGQEITPESYFP